MVSQDTADLASTGQLIVCPIPSFRLYEKWPSRSTYLLCLLTRFICDIDIVNGLERGNEFSKDWKTKWTLQRLSLVTEGKSMLSV